MIDRRGFVAGSALMLARTVWPGRGVAASAPAGRIVAQEPWGRLEEVGEGAWALVSAPLQDRTTICNGGIVGGTERTLVIESFASPAGASWMARMARERTGRWPTDVLVTHFHGDHANGLEGFVDGGPAPQVLMTAVTRDLIRETDRGGPRADNRVRTGLLDGATLVDPDTPTDIDLGGRRVTFTPRSGHTRSDVSITLVGQPVVFCGDLIWNAMFPNYVDAIPTRLATSVQALRAGRATRYVPGHGPLAGASDVDRYVQVIDTVEAAARRAVEAGIPAAEAAQGFDLPASLGEWMRFSPRYFEVAFTAWERELKD